MAVDDQLSAYVNDSGSLSALARADRMSALHVGSVVRFEHIQNLIAVVVTNSRRQAGRELQHAQRNCLRSGRAANPIPDAQCACDQRIALAHFGNATSAFEISDHREAKPVRYRTASGSDRIPASNF